MDPHDETSPARIIAVDDDPFQRAFLRRALERKGYAVEAYEEGERALAALLGPEAPALLLTDLEMPGIHGVEVVRQARQHFSEARLPILVISAHDEEAAILDAYDAGATDYLVKPVSVGELAAKVGRCLRQRRFRAAPEPPQDLLALIDQPYWDLHLESGGLWEFDRFVIVRLLGRGGSGLVFEAREKETGRTVALKLLDPNAAVEPEQLLRFLRERRVMGGMEHPNIVDFYDVGCCRGAYFFSMEYVPGGSVDDLVERAGPLAPPVAARIALSIAQALAHIHGLGLVHRDVKPGNILLDATGAAKLTDFGLAKAACESDITNGQDIVGTLAYMAPELLCGGAPSVASDLYALGVTLATLIAGENPFATEEETGHIIGRILHGAPTWDAAALAQRAPSLGLLAASLMALRPAERPHSAAQAAALLDAYLQERGVPRAELAAP
jgi:CheY-like chemotaxis protein